MGTSEPTELAEYNRSFLCLVSSSQTLLGLPRTCPLLPSQVKRTTMDRPFSDLQLKPNECVRVSACDLSAIFVGKFPIRGPRNLVGPDRHWRSCEHQPSRRCVGSSLPGTVAPSPAISGEEPQRAPGTTSSLESPPHCWGPSAVWDDISAKLGLASALPQLHLLHCASTILSASRICGTSTVFSRSLNPLLTVAVNSVGQIACPLVAVTLQR